MKWIELYGDSSRGNTQKDNEVRQILFAEFVLIEVVTCHFGWYVTNRIT